MIPSNPESEFTPSGFDFEFPAPADYARLYRLRGIQVVPAFMPSEHKSWKRPLLDSWKDYQSALVDDETFAEWYGASGKYVTRPNMGVITGRASNNIFVIDLDHHKSPVPLLWWNKLMLIHNNDMDLETVEQRTGGGGSQKLFRAPPEWTAPTNKTSIGVDIRGQGGFAMLAPSLHESGKTYEWLEGKSPDDIPVTMAPDWLLEAVEKLVAEHGGGHLSTKSSNGNLGRSFSSSETFDGFGSQVDGREEYMRDLIWGAVVDWRRECPIKPSESESLAKAVEKYNVYERHVSPQLDHPFGGDKTDHLNAEGRGVKLFHVKWAAAMRQWDDKVAVEARIKPEPKPGQPEVILPKLDPATGRSKTFELLDIDQIENMPDPVWLVNDLVIDHSIGFIYGPPSSLKTFLALDLALTFTTRQASWWGRQVQRHGAVIYICNEGVGSFKFRIKAWRLHHKEDVKAATTPFFLLRQQLDFMNPEDVGTLLATVESAVVRAGCPIAAVFVDTLSKVLPGAEENQQKDMSLFVKACGMIRDQFGCVVFGVHHTNATGGFRGSTVMPGAGDFMIETRREPGAMEGSIFAKKVKDADDGWEQKFKVTKVPLDPITNKTSLAIDPEGTEPRSKQVKDQLPSDTVREQILTEIDKAWLRGKPWTHSENTARGVVTFMTTKWKISRKVAKALLALWSAHGIIEHGIRDPKNHVSGYKRLIKTDQSGGESNA